MRMMVELDADVAGFAEAYAGARGISLSAAISELVRRAERSTGAEEPSPRLRVGPHGYLVIAGTGHAITPEMVKNAAEDELV